MYPKQGLDTNAEPPQNLAFAQTIGEPFQEVLIKYSGEGHPMSAFTHADGEQFQEIVI